MAANVRPPSQPNDSASTRATRLGRSRATRTEVDYRRLHRGTLVRVRLPSQGAVKKNDIQEPRLEIILKAITGMHDSVDERLALLEGPIDQVPDVGQVKEAVSEEVKDAVQVQLNVIVQKEIVHVIGDEVKRVVQQQVGEVVRREVKSVVQHEVMSSRGEMVAAIVQQQVSIIIQEKVTSIVQEQVTAIIEKKLSSIQQSSLNPSYADIARTPPGSHLSNSRTICNQTTPSTFTDTLYCTVDVSNVEEADRDNASASKIRQDIEKEAAEKIKAAGARVLRDQWYPVKVDNACRTAVLDECGKLRTGIVEMLEKENEVKIAKVSWLSRKDLPKAYGSMVLYVTERADAAKLLEG